MRTKDHDLLGHYLLKRYTADLDPLCRGLFLLGCIEPDWNPITYARGSVKYRFLRGHNAENAQKHLVHAIRTLLESGVETPLQWFRLGAALHYLADSFTFAHNRIFAGNLQEHRLYERRLHTVFVEYLQSPFEESLPMEEDTHKQYLLERRSYQTDCRYILGTALALCDRLSIQWSQCSPASSLAENQS